MKNVLVILDGIIAKKLLDRMVETNTGSNVYDIVYMNDYILPEQKPSNFTFYKFDPTSQSKLKFILDKVIHNEALVVLNTKDDTLSVIGNIRKYKENFHFTVYDSWNLDCNDTKVHYYRGNEVLANGLLEQLPNIPVLAQNIGLKQGEIMEIKIPFGSSYAYRYIGSIAQKDWKIFALYRNHILINVKPSLVLKPNDVILVIGKPEVLTQVYGAISRTAGHFPMPFGNNIYVYCDLYVQQEYEVIDAIKKARFLHQRMKNKELIIKVTRPTTSIIMNEIKDLIKDREGVVLEIDYANTGINTILKEDKKRFDIGLLVLTQSLLEHKEAIKNVIEHKIPIFKVGIEKLSTIKNTVLLLNEEENYEQLSPVVFDISRQLKLKIKIFNMDPIGDLNKDKLISHLENLSKIFNQDIIITSNGNNPMNELKKEQNILQILPIKEEMFDRRRFNFLSTNSDLLSFDLSIYNQILIPIIEGEGK
ncbi:MAG: potassium transporter TrkA [Arcobacteraceae bacterium]|nr:potassium transporter TrkA [Arcobacteraceae bacterium]